MIEKRFLFVLTICALIGIGVAGYVSYLQAFREIRSSVQFNSELLLEMAMSVRGYTSEEISPTLGALEDGDSGFHPQSVPSYAAQAVLARLQESHPDYSYRESSLNPTNVKDRASDWEVSLIRQFQANPELSEIQGERVAKDQSTFYVSRPMRMEDEGCLLCHSTPDAAPKSMLARYGSVSGFNWQMGDVIAIQLVEVPLDKIRRSSLDKMLMTIGITTCVLVLTVVIFLGLLRRMVTHPLTRLMTSASDISLGRTQKASRADDSFKGEFRDLHRSLTRLETSLMHVLQRDEGGPSDNRSPEGGKDWQ